MLLWETLYNKYDCLYSSQNLQYTKFRFCHLYKEMFVCLFVSKKRQNGWTDRAQIFCGTSRDPREGLWMIEFSKISLHQNSIFEQFENPRFFFKSANFFFYNVHKENMFTMEMEDGREAL